jgi:hypothetical protein
MVRTSVIFMVDWPTHDYVIERERVGVHTTEYVEIIAILSQAG